MQKIIVLTGIPGSGKSSYCNELMKKEPGVWKRINNDSLRESLDFGVYSKDNENIIRNVRKFLIKESLKNGFSCVIDNLNLGKRNWEEICSLAKEANVDVQVLEKHFYVELDEAILRDSKRLGNAKVGTEVITKWWKESGKGTFKFYKCRVEVFIQRMGNVNQSVDGPKYNPNLPEAVVCDLDGTLALIHNRSPYDAKDCDLKDLPNTPVIETIIAHHNAGRKIVFCSGREDKFRPETIRFIEKYCIDLKSEFALGNVIPYELHMRKTDDFRKDSIIKEEIYDEHIKDKYNVLLVLDDRSSVCQFWRSIGLICFQVAPGEF